MTRAVSLNTSTISNMISILNSKKIPSMLGMISTHIEQFCSYMLFFEVHVLLTPWIDPKTPFYHSFTMQFFLNIQVTQITSGKSILGPF